MTALPLAILRTAAFLVPRRKRAEWLTEWRSELWYVRGPQVSFCLGAFRDALWLRRNTAPRPLSPLRCCLILAMLAAASISVALPLREQPIPAHLLMASIALLVLSGTTAVNWGEYPRQRRRGWRWLYFAFKIACLSSTVFFGFLALVSFGAAPIAGPGSVAGYVLAFRWALVDQRRRCPVCLQLLTNPVHFGQASQTFLAWYGTELICAEGHGVLQVPEIPASSYSAQRWFSLEDAVNSATTPNGMT